MHELDNVIYFPIQRSTKTRKQLVQGESTRTTRFHFKTKQLILTRFSTLAILPH